MNVEDADGFIMTIDGKDLYLYIHNKADMRPVDYGERGDDYKEGEICNVHIAANNKFFAVGIPTHRALGFFGINRSQLVTKPLIWITKVSQIDPSNSNYFSFNSSISLWMTTCQV